MIARTRSPTRDGAEIPPLCALRHHYVKDILTYKVILIKDQISLINASVPVAKHHSEQVKSFSDLFTGKQRIITFLSYMT